MTYLIDRFEDNGWTVLETDDRETIDVPRSHLPPEAREGDALVELPEDERQGEVRYAVDRELTDQRRQEAEALRASLSTVPDGDLEL
jgi:hypothetical protein